MVLLELAFFVVDGVNLGEHAAMQDPTDENLSACSTKEEDVTAYLDPAQSRTNVLTSAAKLGRGCELLARSFEQAEIASRLRYAPLADGVSDDRIQIRPSAAGEANGDHETTSA